MRFRDLPFWLGLGLCFAAAGLLVLEAIAGWRS